MQAILDCLKQLPYDALLDWLDMAEYYLAYKTDDKALLKSIRLRRRGKVSMQELRPQSDASSKALDLFSSLYPEQAENLIAVARLLAEALMPSMGRRGGEGFIQIKGFRRYKKDKAGQPVLDENGEAKFVDYGPYLYFRYWLTGGDWNSKKKRLASVYIGGNEQSKGEYPYKRLAQKLLDTYEKKGKRQVRTAATEALENRIKACIDFSGHVPIINHSALEILEKELAASDL